jgi:hypothetical protein
MFAHEIALPVLTALERPCDPVLLKNVESTIRNVLKRKASVACLAGRPTRWSLRTQDGEYVWRLAEAAWSARTIARG